MTSTSSAPAGEGGVVIRHQPRKKMSSNRRRSKVPSLSLEGAGEGESRSRSVPNTPDSCAGMELGRDRTGVPESENVALHSPVSRTPSVLEVTPPRAQSAKVRLSGSYSLPLTVIEEPPGETEEGEEGTPLGEEAGLLRMQRSPSPSLQIPQSPVRGPSPNSSPRNTRRIATRRKGSRCESVLLSKLLHYY